MTRGKAAMLGWALALLILYLLRRRSKRRAGKD